MINYKIEGDVDFFSELYKSLDDVESEEKNDSDKNVCLITTQPLIDKHVELLCGHKFNYIPLYKDIVNHKKKFNQMESVSTKLAANELRCPYCRKKQQQLLPFYEDFGLEKIYGVNTIDIMYKPKISYSSSYTPCSYKIPNPKFDDTKPETSDNSKVKNCGCYGSKIAVYNNENPHVYENFGDENLYCYHHKKQMIKNYKLAKKQKEKEDLKNLKQKLKDDAKKEKDEVKKAIAEAKQKEKDEKKAAKELLNQNKEVKPKKLNKSTTISEENVVIGVVNIVSEEHEGCITVLKSGVKKGTSCGCKIFSENMCKRHYNSANNM